MSKLNTMKLLLIFVSAAIAMFLSAPARAASTQTAQSVMIDIAGPLDFIVVGTETWAYNKTTAETYFTNTLASGPVITCTGGGLGGVNCAAGNQPPTPSAPDPNPIKLNPVIGQNKCTFWNGGTLVVSAPQASYTQSVTVNGVNGKGNWKFGWTYNIAVGATNPVDAHTAWDLVSSTGGPVSVFINATIAGQSVVHKIVSKTSWSRKYSFTLLDSVTFTSRITDLTVAVTGTDSNGNPVSMVQYPGHTIDTNPAGYCDLTSTNFYTGNAGENGQVSLLVARPSTTGCSNTGAPTSARFIDILQDLAQACDGGSDNFLNNDSCTGTVHIGIVDQTEFDLLAGSYTVTISGTIKGVASLASLQFTGTANLCINAEDCQICP